MATATTIIIIIPVLPDTTQPPPSTLPHRYPPYPATTITTSHLPCTMSPITATPTVRASRMSWCPTPRRPPVRRNISRRPSSRRSSSTHQTTSCPAITIINSPVPFSTTPITIHSSNTRSTAPPRPRWCPRWFSTLFTSCTAPRPIPTCCHYRLLQVEYFDILLWLSTCMIVLLLLFKLLNNKWTIITQKLRYGFIGHVTAFFSECYGEM